MLDPAAFRTIEPDSAHLPKIGAIQPVASLKEDQLLVCSPTLIGYHFGLKYWCMRPPPSRPTAAQISNSQTGAFSISRISDIVWKPEAFSSLAMPPDEKSLIHALMTSHKSRSTSFDDIIDGKGKGLIGLLSGPPGVGKTLTAEAVSEVTERPLYYLSAGDLGADPERLDEQLSSILELCQVWSAVLLLDEADVFLQKSYDMDVSRNALVSIFLRQLEYFEGILLLTTNRLQSFDPAFQSRIHFSINYLPLAMEARKAIWVTFLTKACADFETSAFGEKELERLAGGDLNGRQIKNVVGTALLIAKDREEDLQVAHVESVLGVLEKWLVATAT